jgi:hypothetical protein
METKFEFPEGGFIYVRVDTHCPFALFTVCGEAAHKCYWAIPRKISYCRACEFVAQYSNHHSPKSE